MAEKYVSVAEKKFTCAVCLEKFKRPQLLKCQHTLCYHCTQQLLHQQGHNSILCPECRQVTPHSEIKANLTMIRFLEKEDEDSCQLCFEEVAVVYCDVKGKKLCNGCAEIHGDKERISMWESNVREMETDLMKVTYEMTQVTAEKEKEHVEFVHEVQQDEKVIRSKLVEERNKVLEAVNKHFDQVEEKVSMVSATKQKVAFQNTRAVLSEIQGMKNKLSAAMDNPFRLYSQNDVLKKEAKELLESMNIRHENMEAKKHLKLCNVSEVAFDKSKALDVVLVDAEDHPEYEEAGEAHLDLKKINASHENNNNNNAAAAEMNIYRCTQIGSCRFQVRSLLVVTDKLWCMLKDQIIIYRKDMTVARIVKDVIEEGHRMALTQAGHVITAGYFSGLVLLDCYGDKLYKLRAGNFWDVKCANSRIFGLQRQSSDLCIIVYNDNPNCYTFELQSDPILVNLPKVLSSGVFTFEVFNSYFYLCTAFKDTIYEVDELGNVLRYFGRKGRANPGELLTGHIIGQDKNGNILIADKDNQRLQIFNPLNETWEILEIDGGRFCKTFAVAMVGDTFEHMYVAAATREKEQMGGFNLFELHKLTN